MGFSISNIDRLRSLFGYECHGGRESELWAEPELFAEAGGQGGKELDEAFYEWKKTKRPFTKEEIISGSWIKINDTGKAFVIKCLKDGTVHHGKLLMPSRILWKEGKGTSWQ